ncbi:MAG: cytochrome c biogenesis protein CcdA [Flavobacteriales bacterium]|jgi:dihydrofolate reductase
MSLFSKKTEPTIDPELRELFENAQARVRQKKRLYHHLVLFVAGAILLIIINLVLGIGKDFTLFNQDWSVWAILLWVFFFLVHFINVFILNRFMGNVWEQAQIDKLVQKQKNRISKLEDKILETSPTLEKKSPDLTKQIPPITDQNTPL